MADERIETAVTKLTRLGDDIDACRNILERTSHAMLQRPALGGQLIALICAVDEDDPSLEALSDLLGAALDTARMAQENSNARGVALLSALRIPGRSGHRFQNYPATHSDFIRPLIPGYPATL